MQELISKREFARRMNVSDSTVRKAIKNGRIFGEAIVGSKLDFAIASTQFNKNKDISKQRFVKPAPIVNLKDILDNSSEDFPEDEESIKHQTFSAKESESEYMFEKTRKERLQGDKLEEQLKLIRNQSIDIEKATFAVFEVMRGQRDHWLKFPDRVSADMAARLGIDKIELKTLLTEEIKKHCQQVKDIKFNAQ
ncbi:MAG: hypothetical protein GY793_05480 [Proteobacteria bacterium]|nr:hypothetical protein [Pseudomonadota bacterium]